MTEAATRTVQIKHWSGRVLFECEIPETVESGMATRHALESAVRRGKVLRGANLRGANLRDADLSDADLSDAVLSDAVLRGAVLRDQKNDFWEILLRAPTEIAGLRAALVEGRVDGSTYEGACACLVGTIANVRGVNYQTVGIKPDSSRPAERWFMGIRKGDKPETSQISAITVEWLDEFVGLINAAKGA